MHVGYQIAMDSDVLHLIDLQGPNYDVGIHVNALLREHLSIGTPSTLDRIEILEKAVDELRRTIRAGNE